MARNTEDTIAVKRGDAERAVRAMRNDAKRLAALPEASPHPSVWRESCSKAAKEMRESADRVEQAVESPATAAVDLPRTARLLLADVMLRGMREADPAHKGTALPFVAGGIDNYRTRVRALAAELGVDLSERAS